MILSRKEIKDLIKTGVVMIRPFQEDHVGPIGVDLTIESRGLDPDTMQDIHLFDTPVKPGQLILVNSAEYLHLPNYLAGKLVNRSSVARLGLLVGLNADLVEPNFSGKVTFSVKNHSTREIWLKPGLRIAQITFEEISSPEPVVKQPRYDYKNPSASDLCEEMIV
jgi:dCTP deaminase